MKIYPIKKLGEVIEQILEGLARIFVVRKTATNKAPMQEVVTPADQSVEQIIEAEPSVSETTKTEESTELETVKEEGKCVKWHAPTHLDHFAIPSQPYLQEDWELYGKFGHHTGVDYGGRKKTGLPLFACADGELIYREIAGSVWGKFLGHHAVVYIPFVDKSFVYCHMADEPRALGPVKAGQQIGIMGNTGKSAGGAIHLHLEGFHGRFEIAWRSFTSLEDIKTKTFDADEFIRSRLN